MKIAICDDEECFRTKLSQYLYKYYRSLDIIIDSFPSGEKLSERFKMNSDAYDLIFLDIEMEQLDGIHTAKRIRQYNQDTIIIFLTSHVEYALEGYEVDAFRFLSKPLIESKLIKALNDVQSEWDRNRKLIIRDFDNDILLPYKDIVYLEAQNVNVHIKTLNKDYTIRKTLNSIGKEVKGPAFYQPHRSYIINLSYVTDYDNKIITMETGETIPLSRNKLSEFKEALMLYVKSCGREG